TCRMLALDRVRNFCGAAQEYWYITLYQTPSYQTKAHGLPSVGLLNVRMHDACSLNYRRRTPGKSNTIGTIPTHRKTPRPPGVRRCAEEIEFIAALAIIIPRYARDVRPSELSRPVRAYRGSPGGALEVALHLRHPGAFRNQQWHRARAVHAGGRG